MGAPRARRSGRSAWRLLTVFEAPDRCILLLVAEHALGQSLPPAIRSTRYRRARKPSNQAIMWHGPLLERADRRGTPPRTADSTRAAAAELVVKGFGVQRQVVPPGLWLRI